jgi:hypothetical protein
MRFSWKGLILAPLLVPALFGATLVALAGKGLWSLLMFPVVLAAGSVVSYATMIFLFLPSLFLLSLWRPMTGLKVCLLGLLLGAAMIVPMTWMDWKSSGVDSGPPTESFPHFFVRWVADPFQAIYPLAGLITAGVYWWIATRRDNGLNTTEPTARSTL